MWRTLLKAVLLLALVCVLSGCQFSESRFTSMVGETGATFAAAATMLEYTHQGRVTTGYTRSSFTVFQANLSGLDSQLPSQSGAPDRRTLQPLLASYHQAMQAIDQPCLDGGCDWQAQVKTLQDASESFIKASEQ